MAAPGHQMDLILIYTFSDIDAEMLQACGNEDTKNLGGPKAQGTW